MSKFFSEKTRDLKELLKETFDKRLVFILLALFVLAVGIIVGAVTDPTPFIYDYYAGNAQNYHYATMYAESSPINILIERTAVNLGYFAVIFALSLIPALFPISLIIMAYRGFILSLTVRIFLSQFGMTGMLTACFLILPQNVITSVSLIVCAVATPLIKKRCVGKKYITNCLLFCALFYAISLSGAIFETLVLSLLIRPLNFYF
ncbi:MAG: stage II sporulation protein M [Clostridia bacterium]|nr:stage II sporulation protein M [Clostridia bacterium]